MSFLQIPLGELYDISSGLSKGKAFFGHGFPFLTFKTVFDSFFLPDELAELADTTEKERETCSILRGDVFLTRTSENTDELGMSSVALKDYPNATFNGFTKRLRPKPCVQINPLFASYWFRSTAFRKQVKSMSVMTTRASLNTEMIRRLTMPFPTIEEQDAIANILYPLDEKMAINFTLNHHLEQIAQMIFKSWATDCSEFVTIGDVVDNILDYTPNNNNPIVLINSGDVHNGHFTHHTLSANENLKGHFKKRFSKGDILYSEIRPRNKHFAFVPFEAEKYIASTRLMVLRSKSDRIFQSLLYHYLKSDEVIEQFATMTETRSGTFPQGCFADLASIPITVNSLEKQRESAEFLDNVILTIATNDGESTRLATLRDALLPRLMSGELSVSSLGGVK